MPPAVRHICRRCHQVADIPAYRAAIGDWLCADCHRAYRRRRAALGLRKKYPPPVRDQRIRDQEAARFRARLVSPIERPRINARRKAQQAIAKGVLVRGPCEVCGAPKTEAHHDDYSQPLDVRWLCHAHHVEHHVKAALADTQHRSL